MTNEDPLAHINTNAPATAANLPLYGQINPLSASHSGGLQYVPLTTSWLWTGNMSTEQIIQSDTLALRHLTYAVLYHGTGTSCLSSRTQPRGYMHRVYTHLLSTKSAQSITKQQLENGDYSLKSYIYGVYQKQYEHGVWVIC